MKLNINIFLLLVFVGGVAWKNALYSIGTNGLRTIAIAGNRVLTGSLPSKKFINNPVTGVQAGKWVYQKTTSKTGMALQTASVSSVDKLDFAPPFQGGSTLTLTIRKRGAATTVLFSVSKGQFTSSFQGGKMRIRFDTKLPVIYAFSAAGDGSTDVIFFDDVPALVSQLKASRKMVAEVGFYGQGIRRVEFRTADLRWQ